jgi:four helix bundle protein
MPIYKNFEGLSVWNTAIELAARIFTITEADAFRYKDDLVNQLRCASLSISNNIAEGFERGSTKELINFLYIARGSAGETRSMLRFALRLDALQRACEPEITSLIDECLSISRQIRAWLDNLQNSPIEGQRHLNDQTRRRYERAQSSEAFQGQIAAFKSKMGQGLRDGSWGKKIAGVPPAASARHSLTPSGNLRSQISNPDSPILKFPTAPISPKIRKPQPQSRLLLPGKPATYLETLLIFILHPQYAHKSLRHHRLQYAHCPPAHIH